MWVQLSECHSSHFKIAVLLFHVFTVSTTLLFLFRWHSLVHGLTIVGPSRDRERKGASERERERVGAGPAHSCGSLQWEPRGLGVGRWFLLASTREAATGGVTVPGSRSPRSAAPPHGVAVRGAERERHWRRVGKRIQRKSPAMFANHEATLE